MNKEEWTHKPVLSEYVVGALLTDPSGIYLDATVGLGGHAAAILDRLNPEGKIVALDWDPEALELAEKNLSRYSGRVIFVRGNFADAAEILRLRGIRELTGALLDLGVSSMHFENAARGFSLKRDGPLDMRINPGNPLTAAEIVNHWPCEQIEEILRACGEERGAGRIARAIVRARSGKPIKTTGELRGVIESIFPARGNYIHPATRTFMALRIAVNGELENLEQGLESISGVIKNGGRFAVITFHSLEDRIVKQAFRALKNTGEWNSIGPKFVKPGIEEAAENPRARSAKLRILGREGAGGGLAPREHL